MNGRESALDALNRLAPHRVGDDGTWLKVGMALHSAGPGRDMLEAWELLSCQSHKHQHGECECKWRSFRARSGIGIGTLLAWIQARKRGEGGR